MTLSEAAVAGFTRLKRATFGRFVPVRDDEF